MLKDNINITIDIFKVWAKIENDKEDDILHKLLDGASNKAQRFMNNEFTSGEVPADVEIWIMKRALRNYQQRTEGLSSESVSDISNTYGPNEFDDLLPYRVFVGC